MVSRRVLNVGGNSKSTRIPPYFDGWTHDLLDIDPTQKPDILQDARDLASLTPETWDAIYCSHCLEHFHAHEVRQVLDGFRHVLKRDGFAEIRVPDILAVCGHMVQHDTDLDDILYTAPAGPISIKDVLWGYGKEIERSGQVFYAHKTGFTPRSLRTMLLKSGFASVISLGPLSLFEIRVVAFKEQGSRWQAELFHLQSAESNRESSRKGRPDIAAAVDRAVQLHRSGNLRQAENLYRGILSGDPRNVPALMNLGSLLRQTGRPIDAIGLYRHALVYEPRNAGVLSNLGHALSQVGLYQEAIETLRRAIETDRNSHMAWDNLGHCYSRLERYDEAAAALTRAVQINPRNANAWNNLGGVRLAQCQMEEAISCFRKAVEIDPANAMARSNILFALNFSPKCTVEQMAQEHRAWHEQHATPLAGEVAQHPPRDIQKSPLRVGFVSPDFCEHPVGRFLAPLFRGRTPEGGWQAICYSDVLVPDARTQWLRRRSDEWRDTVGLSDGELARLVLQDRIDILIDLAGHTGRNRLLMLARKPAPVQASWLGYFNTTGLRTMDYLIADRVCIPEEAEPLYTEKIIRLPDDFVCYEPPPIAPPVNELPALKRGYVTFGVFNQMSKVSESAMRAWAEVLRRLPNARLVLRGKAFNDKSIMDYFVRKFTGVGLSEERLVLLPKTSFQKYLTGYNEVDIALDSFPFVGGTTTCDSLWMGVPVVTFSGDRFCGRHSASHLINAGLPEMVAESVQGYIDLAVDLAGNLERLASIRATLREKMAKSPLCDAERFAGNFSKALRAMWRGDKG